MQNKQPRNVLEWNIVRHGNHAEYKLVFVLEKKKQNKWKQNREVISNDVINGYLSGSLFHGPISQLTVLASHLLMRNDDPITLHSITQEEKRKTNKQMPATFVYSIWGVDLFP